MNVFAFDIETVPDVRAARRLHGFRDLPDEEVTEAMLALRRQQSGGSDFQRHHLHRIVVISVAARMGGRFRVFSLGEGGDDESEILTRFFDGIDRYTPQLVSWNGSGFDLPVLHYRALMHGVPARRYWDTGAEDREFRFNNYLNRFHERHLDLMDVLAGYQPRAGAPLDELAALCGLPGKMGMDGSQVHARIADGDFASVRDYCETDVLNTYLLYLRFQLLRGHLDRAGFDAECDAVRETLLEMDQPHLNVFLDAWAEAAHD